MVVGSAAAGSRVALGLKFTCLEDKLTRWPEYDAFPAGPCKGGIMTVHHFPSSAVQLSRHLLIL